MTVQFDASAGDSTLYMEGFGGTDATDFTILTDTNGADLTTTDGAAWIDGSEICTTSIQNVITGLEKAESELRVKAKNLSSDLSIITAREDFTAKMMNTLEDGAATLTEADMNEEGANMLMLQTRQALGTTSLSLASQAAQSVMRLF